jgi:hypothetical protein
MSFGGCGFTGDRAFEVGEQVRIAIAGQGYIKAEMRWSSEGRAGARFLCQSPA